MDSGNVYNIFPIIDALSVRRIEVRFMTSAQISQKAWLGASIRNRFLSACEKVEMPDSVLSLREMFNKCSLPPEHFLFKYLNDGFPKAFVWDVSKASHNPKRFLFLPDTEYTINLMVFGHAQNWIDQIIKAILIMMEMGLGNPPLPLHVTDIKVHEPKRAHDYAKRCYNSPVDVTLNTLTPLSLCKHKAGSGKGYQSKMNGFPSMYQIIKSASSRIATLGLLYAEECRLFDYITSVDQWNELIEGCADLASTAWLKEAEIKYVTAYSTPKESSDKVYSFGGYSGTLVFSDISPYLVPLLKMAGRVGEGTDVAFGMGFFSINVNEF